MNTTLHDLNEELNEIRIKIGVEKKIVKKRKKDLRFLKIRSLKDAKKVLKKTTKELKDLDNRLQDLNQKAEEILIQIEEGTDEY